MEIEVLLPDKVTTNAYYAAHYLKRSNIKQGFKEAAILAARNKGKIDEYPINVTYSFHLIGRPVDWVNLSAMAKMIEDGLVQAKVIEDDAPKFISQGMLIYNKSKRKYSYCVVELGWAG